MPFGSRDLLTKALPQSAIDPAQLARICLLHSFVCRYPTWCFHSCVRWYSECLCSTHFTDIVGCRILNTCPGGSVVCNPTPYCGFGSDPWIIKDLEDLVSLRAELNQTLEQLNVIEKEGLASGITTRAQADQLEAELKTQLAHLQKVRKGISE